MFDQANLHTVIPWPGTTEAKLLDRTTWRDYPDGHIIFVPAFGLMIMLQRESVKIVGRFCFRLEQSEGKLRLGRPEINDDPLIAEAEVVYRSGQSLSAAALTVIDKAEGASPEAKQKRIARKLSAHVRKPSD